MKIFSKEPIEQLSYLRNQIQNRWFFSLLSRKIWCYICSLLVNIFFSFALFFLFRVYGVFLNTTITVIKVFWQENGNTGLLVKNTKSLWKSRGADKCSRFIIKKEEMKIFQGNFAALPSSSLKSKCWCLVFTLLFWTKKISAASIF